MDFRDIIESRRAVNFFDPRATVSPEEQQAFACKNAGFFAMALMFAARELGLHSHPMDGFDHEAVRKLFVVPDNYWIPLLLAVGHFDQTKTLLPPKWRKSYEEILVSFD